MGSLSVTVVVNVAVKFLPSKILLDSWPIFYNDCLTKNVRDNIPALPVSGESSVIGPVRLLLEKMYLKHQGTWSWRLSIPALSSSKEGSRCRIKP